MDFSKLFLDKNILGDFGGEALEFYHKVLNKEMKLRSESKVLRIKRALKVVTTAYNKVSICGGFSSLRFDSEDLRYAYVLKYCLNWTLGVASHLWRLLLVKYPNLLETALEERQLNVCCLGCGPGTEAVAIAKIVSAVQKNSGVENERPLSLCVFFVDINNGWEITCRNVKETLESDRQIFDSRNVSLTFKFLKADLTKPLNKDVQQALENADIVTMVKFLSAVTGNIDKIKSSNMLKGILKHVKTRGVVINLESVPIYAREINAVTSTFENFREIYVSSPAQYLLPLDTVQKCIETYAKKFGFLPCQTQCLITAKAWSKFTSKKDFNAWNAHQGKLEKEDSTSTSEEYYQKIKKLVADFLANNVSESSGSHESKNKTSFVPKRLRNKVTANLEKKD